MENFTEIFGNMPHLNDSTGQYHWGMSANKTGAHRHVPFFSIIIGSIAGIGLLMNIFVLVVMLATKKLRKKISVTFLISQCTMDSVSMVNLLLFHIIENLELSFTEASGRVYCKIVFSEMLVYTALYAGILNTVALSAERYVAIVHPIRYKSAASRRRFVPMIVASWLIAFVINIPFTSMATYDGDSCVVNFFLDSNSAQIAYTAVTIILVYLAPVVTITFFYITMMKKLRARRRYQSTKHTEYTFDMRSAAMEESIQRAQIRLAKTGAALGMTFIITWTPYNLYLVGYTIGAPLNFSDPGYFISAALIALNPVINPLIYVFSLKEFRRSVKQLFIKSVNNIESSTLRIWYSASESQT